MKVLKFGGTSVGTVESLANVKKIVEAIPDNAVVVVSALGGLTDLLISTAGMAEKKDEEWKEEFFSIEKRHNNIIEKVVPHELKEHVKHQVGNLLSELEKCYEAVSRKGILSTSELDMIVSFGERLSSVIVAAMLDNGRRYYSPDFIKTEKRYGKNVAEQKLTETLIKQSFTGMAKNEKAVVPGFISTDCKDGSITNLGRGGSDFTAALIAAALDAEILEIWTDVDGFMTADPRIVKDALIIDNLSFTESMELCSYGAKVVYPPTIYPVFHKNIPIKILNTFNPKAFGTLITEHPHREDFDIKGISALKDLTLFRIESAQGSEENNYLKRSLNALTKKGITVIPLTSNDPMDNAVNFIVASSEEKIALVILKEEFSNEAICLTHTPNIAIVALVGKAMKNRGRLISRIGHSLSRAGIETIAFSDRSDFTFLYVIEKEKVNEALPLIHSLIYAF